MWVWKAGGGSGHGAGDEAEGLPNSVNTVL